MDDPLGVPKVFLLAKLPNDWVGLSEKVHEGLVLGEKALQPK